jgi:hypothetical protein
MDEVKRLTKIGVELKKAGKIAKFQVINRKGQPVLQTGTRNQNYSDFQGDVQDDESDNNGEWNLVQNRRKRPHPDGTLTSPNSRPLEADKPRNSQPPPTAATWAALTEQEFPELGSQANSGPAKQKPTTNKTPAQPQSAKPQATQSQAVQPQAAQRGAQRETEDQPSKKQPSRRPVEAMEGPHQPSRGAEVTKRPQQQTSQGPAEDPRGTQPCSYPASRASSRQNSRPSTPPPIRSLFDDDRSDDLRVIHKPKPQRQFQSKAAQHQQHSRNGY